MINRPNDGPADGGNSEPNDYNRGDEADKFLAGLRAESENLSTEEIVTHFGPVVWNKLVELATESSGFVKQVRWSTDDRAERGDIAEGSGPVVSQDIFTDWTLYRFEDGTIEATPNAPSSHFPGMVTITFFR